jgi:ABC-type uncharacterized transport system permease subunit
MQTLIELLGLASLMAMLYNFTPYTDLIDKYIPHKPFNCTMCATFWLTIGINIALHGWSGICYSALEAVLAELIDRQLNKY